MWESKRYGSKTLAIKKSPLHVYYITFIHPNKTYWNGGELFCHQEIVRNSIKKLLEIQFCHQEKDVSNFLQCQYDTLF